MDSYRLGWVVTIGLMMASLALVTAGLLFLAWRIWRRPPAWWRWPALVAILVGGLGGIVSLAQMAAGI